jgi:hypothetical protein
VLLPTHHHDDSHDRLDTTTTLATAAADTTDEVTISTNVNQLTIHELQQLAASST